VIRPFSSIMHHGRRAPTTPFEKQGNRFRWVKLDFFGAWKRNLSWIALWTGHIRRRGGGCLPRFFDPLLKMRLPRNTVDQM